MTPLRSSASFRSNIYPASAIGPLYNDRRFLDAISDAEALDILWHWNGSQGSKLNTLQQRQHEKAIHCSLAEEGDYPWGTIIGTHTVSCLCEKVDCPRYQNECSRFQPKGFKIDKGVAVTPSPKAVDTKASLDSVEEHVQNGSKERPQGDVKHKRSSFTFVSASSVERKSREQVTSRQESLTKSSRRKPQKKRFTTTWTPSEDEILREMYPIFGISVRKWTKRLPYRSVQEITDRASELQIRYVPQRERRNNMGDASVKKGNDPSKAERERHREKMRRRPWGYDEDETIRKWYPRYGAEMKDWPVKLYFRTKDAVEKRARQLGL